MKSLDALLLLGALSIFLSQIYYAAPVTSDAFENFRVIKHLERGGVYPAESSAIGGNEALYPPLFSFAMFSFKALTGFHEYFILNFFSYLFLLMIVYSSFLLLRELIGEETKALLGVFGMFSLPILLYRLVTPIPELLGVVFFLLSLYAYQKKNFKLLLLLLIIFPFAHTRSFVFTIATLGIASLLRKDYIQLAKHAIGGIAVFAILQLAYPINALGFSNAAITFPALSETFPPLAIAMILLGGALLFLRRKMLDEINIAIIASFIVLYFLLPFPFRHVIFLLVPLGILSAEVLNIDKRALVAFAVFLPLTIMQTAEFRAPPFEFEEMEVLKELMNYEGENAIASFSHNYALPYLAEKKVVLGSFAEGLTDGGERSDKLAHYFSSNDDEGKKAILEYYKIGLGFIERRNSGFEERVGERKLLESDNYRVFSFSS